MVVRVEEMRYETGATLRRLSPYGVSPNPHIRLPSVDEVGDTSVTVDSSNSWLLLKPRATYILPSPTYKASTTHKVRSAMIRSKPYTMVRNTLLGYPQVLFIALLGAIKLGLLLRLQAAWQQTFPEHVPRAGEFSYLGTDYPREFPMAPLGNVETFIEASIHYQLNGTVADSEWETLFPGNGLIVLGPHEQVFSISMFHQLRCLNIIRNAIVERGGIWGHNGSSELVHHCVNYLRQMVLCRASLHLDDVVGRGRPEVFTDIFECKDWDMVYSTVKENQRIHSKHRIFRPNGYQVD